MKIIDTILNYILGFFLVVPCVAMMCVPIINIYAAIFITAGKGESENTMLDNVILKSIWFLVVLSNGFAIIYTIMNQ